MYMYQLEGGLGKSEWLPLPLAEVAVVDGWGDVAEPIEPWDGAVSPPCLVNIFTKLSSKHVPFPLSC